MLNVYLLDLSLSVAIVTDEVLVEPTLGFKACVDTYIIDIIVVLLRLFAGCPPIIEIG